jgi:two-component system OmpR family response regulator
MDTRILLVEDEKTLRETLAYNLTQAGYQVVQSSNGMDALELARAEMFQLIVLDIMLPELDGLSFCRILRREQSTPIIFVTARSSELDRIIGLEGGADDYIVKPFSLDEFMARVRVVLRRTSAARLIEQVESGNLTLDLRSRRVRLNGQSLKLSQKEFDLLAVLMQNRGAVLTRDLLVQQVWGYDHSGNDRTVDVHVRWLREKIEADPSAPQRIVTVRGVGYRFEA